jgi:hypothetical protein
MHRSLGPNVPFIPPATGSWFLIPSLFRHSLGLAPWGNASQESFVTQPHVVDFVDIVMHDGTLEFRLEELVVSHTSSLSGRTMRSAQLRDRTGALVLAIRRPEGGFVTNPSPEDVIESGDVLISVDAAQQLEALARYAERPCTADTPSLGPPLELVGDTG